MVRAGQGIGAFNAGAAARVARTMAETLPVVHHPASARFSEWSTWGALQSRGARGESIGPSAPAQLRGHHVFTYAGPSCYGKGTAVGDAAAYFDRSAEAAAAGSATSFDSGALVEPTPCLQPWASKDEGTRWSQFQSQEVPMDRWRESFRAWLERCYDDPARYLDSDGNPYSVGTPERPEPPDLTEHNGLAGTAKHAWCADRRAWTWEVRFRDRLDFRHARVLHVPHDRLNAAQVLADQLERVSGRSVDVKTLLPGVPGSARTIGRDSGRVLREVVGV